MPPLDASNTNLTDFGGNWEQHRIGIDPLPYADLNVDSGYGRKLVLPDDMPPTLSLIHTLGPTKPNIAQSQADGSINVHVMNQSGGGGGGVPLSAYQANNNDWSGIACTGANVTQNSATSAGATTVFGGMFSMYWDQSTIVAGMQCSFFVSLVRQGSQVGPYIAQANFGYFKGTPAANIPVGGTVYFTPQTALDIVKTLGGNGACALIIGTSGGTSYFDGTLWYI